MEKLSILNNEKCGYLKSKSFCKILSLSKKFKYLRSTKKEANSYIRERERREMIEIETVRERKREKEWDRERETREFGRKIRREQGRKLN